MIKTGESSEHFTVTGQGSHSLALSEKEKINKRLNSQHCMTGNRIITPKRKSSFGENFGCLWVIFYGFYCRYFTHVNSQKIIVHTLGWKRPVSNSAVFLFLFRKTRHLHSTLNVMYGFSMQSPDGNSQYVLWKLERTSYFLISTCSRGTL